MNNIFSLGVNTMRTAALLLVASIFGAGSLAATILPSTSTLGLNTGDTYVFVFVTSTTTTATSNSASTYNTIVQNLANSASIGSGIGLTWRAMISTGSTPNRAIDLAPVPATTRVFRVDGTMVANGGTNPFYSFSVDHLAPINVTELGTTIAAGSTADRVWTGGNANGSESGSGLMGSGSPVFGHANGTEADNGTTVSWSREGNASNSNQYRLYAISNILTAQSAAIPEPGTWALMGSALVGLGVLRRRK